MAIGVAPQSPMHRIGLHKHAAKGCHEGLNSPCPENNPFTFRAAQRITTSGATRSAVEVAPNLPPNKQIVRHAHTHAAALAQSQWLLGRLHPGSLGVDAIEFQPNPAQYHTPDVSDSRRHRGHGRHTHGSSSVHHIVAQGTIHQQKTDTQEQSTMVLEVGLGVLAVVELAEVEEVKPCPEALLF